MEKNKSIIIILSVIKQIVFKTICFNVMNINITLLPKCTCITNKCNDLNIMFK